MQLGLLELLFLFIGLGPVVTFIVQAVRLAELVKTIPLTWLLDGVTSLDGAETDYGLSEPLKCPRCAREVTEETLVEW